MTRLKAGGRTVLFNILFLAAFVAAIGGAGEAYLRAAWPFPSKVRSFEEVPGVGLRLRPGSEVHLTDLADFWTVSRANSLGFLDREPISPKRAAGSCHVAVVGDSFVEAAQVQMADKLHIRMERMAAQRLPALDITASAWGVASTGQAAQLPWWEEWIRHLSPKIVVLVFVDNDFWNNSRPPRTLRLSSLPPSGEFQLLLSMLPEYTSKWFQSRWRRRTVGTGEDRGPVPEHYRVPTEVAFDRWIEQVEGSGTRLIVLSSHTIGRFHSSRTTVKQIASSRGVPVVDQLDYILRAGGDPRDAHWPHDDHWSPQGHQWAAEALLEWLAANPQTCG